MGKEQTDSAPLPESTSQPLSFPLAFTALTLGAIAMGASPVFVRYAEIGPFASAFWRVLLALPVLLIWTLLENRAQKTSFRDSMKFDQPVVLAGLFFTGDLIFWHLSIMGTTIANATLMACLAPVWVVLFSAAFIGETVERKTIVGLAFCLIGAFFLIGSSLVIAPERLWGDFFGLITSLFFGLYFLAIRVARRKHQAGALTFMSAIITSLCLLVATLLSGQGFLPATLTGVAALLALGVISHSGGQGLLSVALGSLSATFSSLVIFIEALAAAVLGWIIFNESLTALQFIGGGLIMLGIWFARPQNED